MNGSARFGVNEKEVSGKVIDGEVIIINLAKGLYYSLENTGAEAWVLIVGGHSVDEAAEILSSRYSAPVELVRSDLTKLVGDLSEQRLVMPTEGDRPDLPQASLGPPSGNPYQTPLLNSYEDMADVLALDPPLPQIDVDDESWHTAH